MNLSRYAKLDFVRRSHMAKHVMMHFESDLSIKRRFFKSLKKKPFATRKLKLMLKFFKGRLHNSETVLSNSKKFIELSNQTYENIVSNALSENAGSINKTMKMLAIIQVMIQPFNIISSYMGCNVMVPF